MTLKEKIEVMQAFERGEKIERAHTGASNWQYAYEPTWNWVEYCYRIKPKPKQTVMIEKWLVEGRALYSKEQHLQIVETSNINAYIKFWGDYKKIKLICTYEVPL